METFKTTLSIAGLLIAATIFNGCEKGDILPGQPDNPTAEIGGESQKMIDLLVEEYGFARESIQEYPDEFIADSDLSFPKANFWENYGQPQESFKHYRYTNLVTRVRVIPVRISSNVPSSWKTAFLNAITKWNALQGRVTFSYCNPASVSYPFCSVQPGVNVSYANLGTGWSNTTIAIAQFPISSGYPGTYCKINGGFAGTLTSSQKLFAAIHELGHTIGIRHTDTGEGALINTSVNACNIYTDPYSVMRAYVGSFSAFTTCDIAAFKRLYPKPN